MPHLVANLQWPNGADLELPLAGHDLRVDAADAQARLQATWTFYLWFF